MKIKVRTVLKEHSGVMVAWMMPRGLQDVLGVSKDSFAPGSKFVPRAEYHITLAYLGEASELQNVDAIRASISKIANETAPFWIYIGGTGRFSNVEDGKYDAVYAKVRSAGLNKLFERIKDAIQDTNPEWYSSHKTYTPHMTLAYVPPGSKDTAEVSETEVLAIQIALVLAGNVEYFTLKGNKNTAIKQVLTLNQV